MKALYCLLPVALIAACKPAQPTQQARDRTKQHPTDTLAQTQPMERQNSREDVDTLPPGLRQFVPPGYSVISVSSGDANLDKRRDYIIVMKSDSKDSLSNAPEGRPTLRPMMLITSMADGRLGVAARNDRAVECYDCGGVFDDPFINTVIKDGYFTIEHGVAGGAHWESFTTFKYDKARNDWFLYKDHYTSYKLNENADENAEALVTDFDKMRTVKDFGEVRFVDYDTYKDH